MVIASAAPGAVSLPAGRAETARRRIVRRRRRRRVWVGRLLAYPWTAADAVSLVRPPLTLLALALLYEQPVALAVSLTIILLLDVVDGWIARRWRSSPWGAFIDVIGDRGVELSVLFTYAVWGWIPIVIPIVFLVRGTLTDIIRLQNERYPDARFPHPLSVGGADNRPLRAIYNVVKIGVCVVVPLAPAVGVWIAWLALAVNLYRGLPVILSRRGRWLLARLLRGPRPALT